MARVRRGEALALGGVAVGGAVLLRVVDPNVPGTYPVCPSISVLGVWCPLCGGLRSVHALASGDLIESLAMNPLVPLGVLALLTGLVAWRWRGWRPTSPTPMQARVGVVVLVAFAVARNVIPGLAPS